MKNEEKIITELFCLACGADSGHDIGDNNKHVIHAICGSCEKKAECYTKIITVKLPIDLSQKIISMLPKKLNEQTSEHGETDDDSKSCFLETYSKNLIYRIITKPSRLSQEMRSDICSFLHTIPVRVITKPARLANEIAHIKNKSRTEHNVRFGGPYEH